MALTQQLPRQSPSLAKSIHCTFPTYLTTRMYQMDHHTAKPLLKLGHCARPQEVNNCWVVVGVEDYLCSSHWTAVGCLTSTTILQPADQCISWGPESLGIAGYKPPNKIKSAFLRSSSGYSCQLYIEHRVYSTLFFCVFSVVKYFWCYCTVFLRGFLLVGW